MMNKLEINYRNLERVIDWIKNADTKANIVLALDIVIAGYLFTSSDKITLWLTQFSLSASALLGLALLIMFLCSLALSVYNALRVLLPDINPIAKHKNHFFGSIAVMQYEKFRSSMVDVSERDALEAIIEQSYINSMIANNKFQHLKRSWKFLAWSIPFGLLVLAILQLQ